MRTIESQCGRAMHGSFPKSPLRSPPEKASANQFDAFESLHDDMSALITQHASVYREAIDKSGGLDAWRQKLSSIKENTGDYCQLLSMLSRVALRVDQNQAHGRIASFVASYVPPALGRPTAGLPSQRLPLRDVVSQCLRNWGVNSDSSDEDSDDFCGWRVGSRAVARTSPVGARHGQNEDGDLEPSDRTSKSALPAATARPAPGLPCMGDWDEAFATSAATLSPFTARPPRLVSASDGGTHSELAELAVAEPASSSEQADNLRWMSSVLRRSGLSQISQ